ncbi:ComF family protein [Candidatus Gottesmanbacteria bacterium]|nr:ComF family protein [Candidatus Gottesmanbacteria bacterium]
MHLLDLIFPPRCVSCNHLGTYFCQNCRRKIEFLEHQICPVCAKLAIGSATHPRCQTRWGLDGMYALAHYRGPIKDAIFFLKYKFVTDLTDQLINILLNNLPEIIPQFDYLIPIPLHPRKEKERGFNQSFLIAKLLEKKLNIPLNINILYRIRYTQPQAKLKKKERLTNLDGAFSVGKNINIAGKVIALVDDVSTTRATLFESAKVLKSHGAHQVWGLVLAHG